MLQPDLVSHLVVVRSSLSLPNERLQSPSRYNIEFKSTALQLRLRKLACHEDRRGEKCSSCSLCARVKRENRARSAEYSFALASIGTVDAFGVRLLVSGATFKLANRSGAGRGTRDAGTREVSLARSPERRTVAREPRSAPYSRRIVWRSCRSGA